jgi:hypothetical protein
VAFRVGRGVVELVLSDFPEAALARDEDRGELRAVARHFGLEASRWQGERHADAPDDRHPYLNRDPCLGTNTVTPPFWQPAREDGRRPPDRDTAA